MIGIHSRWLALSLVLVLGPAVLLADEQSTLIRSAAGGRWSARETWEGGKVPGAGSRVQVRAGHVVTYDVKTTEPIRSIHVAGTLRFDPERDTRLDVGLIKIQAGDDASESGFDCEDHVTGVKTEAERAVLEVGTADRPIPEGHQALDPAGICQRARSGKLPGDCVLRRADGVSRRTALSFVGQAGGGHGQGGDRR